MAHKEGWLKVGGLSLKEVKGRVLTSWVQEKYESEEKKLGKNFKEFVFV